MKTSELGIARPRVFISSTIRDLRDLRSALRYWLESAGYDVQLSEYNDFDRRPETGTLEACFANVAASDYYILLVGRERGSWYEEDERVTVTRQEFRVASQTAGTRPLRIIAFVRKDVATALQQWRDDGCPAAGSSGLVDPSFTDEFLREVETQIEDEESPGSRWIYEFGDFRDIIDALRVVLRLTTDVARRLVEDNLLGELVYNLSRSVTKTERGSVFPKHRWARSVRRGIIIRKEDLGQDIWLASPQVGTLGMIGLSYPTQTLRDNALAEALKQGLYLKIDPQSGEFEMTDARRALEALYDDTRALVSLGDSELMKQVRLEFMLLSRRANTGQLGAGAHIEAEKLTMTLALYDRMEDVFNGMARFAQWLLGAVDSPAILRKSRSPIEGMNEEIAAEEVTTAQLKWALAEQVHPFGHNLTPEMKDLLAGRLEGLVEELRALIPADVISDEALAGLIQDGLQDFVVEPSEQERGDTSSN